MRAAWLSGGLAILAAFFIVAVVFPDTNVDVDISKYPSLRPHPVYLCVIIVSAFIPALAIFLFGKRWFVVESVGWMILTFLLIGCLEG